MISQLERGRKKKERGIKKEVNFKKCNYKLNIINSYMKKNVLLIAPL